MAEIIEVKTNHRTEFINIEHEISRVIKRSGISDGLCCIFVPHTTAGVTINENADPDVVRDMLTELNKVVPFNDNYSHSEGNSAAHIKSSIIGASLTVIVENGALKLGTWQSIYFCEFDGPRTRKVWVKLIPIQ